MGKVVTAGDTVVAPGVRVGHEVQSAALVMGLVAVGPGLVARAFGFAWLCEHPLPQTCGAFALRSFRSQATRFSGPMERRFTAEKIFGEDVPHSGQLAGALD